jgi:8-oxo-dGTP pyrophosphatase MutT (NUDIX family)
MNITRPISRQPIPNNAQKVFQGKIFDVYQWQQKMFDGSISTFEKIRRADTVGVIPITDDGKLILSQQEQPGSTPYIGTLGGRIDENESPIEAAKRELLEEAGMECDELILWTSEQFLEKIDWAIYTFIAKGCHKIKNQSLDSGEKIKLIEVTFDEFLDLVSKENYRDLEIALRIFRISKNPQELIKLRKLFSPKTN